MSKMKKKFMKPCVTLVTIKSTRTELMAGSLPNSYKESLQLEDGDGSDALARKRGSIWDDEEE